MILLQIDNREVKLIDLLKSRNVPYTTENLQIGDIIISNIDKTNQIILERKTLCDLVASIKDGRYREQKIRLTAEKVRSNGGIVFGYIIEGDSIANLSQTDQNLAFGGIISSTFRDNIPVLRTNSLDETLNLILRLVERCTKNIGEFFPIQTQNDESVSTVASLNTVYLQNVKKNKKDNLTPDTWFHLALVNIPSVSDTIAAKITDHYPSLQSLITAYTNPDTNEDEKKQLLAEIVLTQNEKTKRRIGKVVSERVYQYIMHS